MAIKNKPPTPPRPEAKPEEERDWVDEASDESFPASDPPSWTPTQGAGPPCRQQPCGETKSSPDRPPEPRP